MKIHQKSSQGSALLLTLVATGILTLALGSYLYLVSHQFRSTARSQQWNSSIPIAEAGIEEAIAHLNRNYNTNGINKLTPDVNSGGWGPITSDTIEKVHEFEDGSRYVVQIKNPTTLNPEIYTEGYARYYGINSAVPFFASTAGGGNPEESKFVQRNVRAVTRLMPLFDHAIAADGTIDFSGIVETDSFNSRDPLLSTGGVYVDGVYVNGQYDASKRNGNGDVATNADIERSLNVGNGKIRGRVSTGPDSTADTLDIGPNGAVGDTTFVDTGGEGVQEGYYDNDMNVDFEDVDLPFTNGGSASGGTRTEYEIVTTPRSTDCSCSGYTTSPCCTPPVGPNGEVGEVTVVTEPETTAAQPPAGSYIGTLTPQWTTVRNSKTAPTGDFRNVEINTRAVSSTSYPSPGTYVGTVTTKVKNNGTTTYEYNEITGYDYEKVGSYSYAKITGYKRDFSVHTTNSFTKTYQYIFEGGKKYEVASITGSVLVEGPGVAEVLCTGDISITGNDDGIWIRPGASLKLYCAGETASITGQGIMNEGGAAENFSYYGLPTNTKVNITGNGTFIGTIYAPDAVVNLKGGGSGEEDFIGALIAKEVNMVGKFKFHYDEALAAFGPSRGYRVTSWREE